MTPSCGIIICLILANNCITQTNAKRILIGCERTALHLRTSISRKPRYHVISNLSSLKRSVDDDCGEAAEISTDGIQESAVAAISTSGTKAMNNKSPVSEKSSLGLVTSKRTGIQSAEGKLRSIDFSNKTSLEEKIEIARKLTTTSKLNKDILHLPDTPEPAVAKDTLHLPDKSSSEFSKPTARFYQTENGSIGSKTNDHISKETEHAAHHTEELGEHQSTTHIFNDETAERRNAKKPNLNALKNSPLWSLSKLIDDVGGEPGKKKHLNSSFAQSELKSNDTKVKMGKSLFIGGNEKQISANRLFDKLMSHQIGQKKSVNEKINTTNKQALVKSNKTSSDAEGKSMNKNSTAPKPKEAPDPYAEIAAGPDRPKIPELKSDDAAAAGNPLMKMDSEGLMSHVKNSKPLSGQHDVGGLLDSLTDKLNSAGGGAAPEQPLTLPQDVNSQLNEDNGMMPKDPQQEEIPMEKPPGEGMSAKEDAPLPEVPPMHLGKEVADHPPMVPEARMEQAAAAVGLDKEVMEKLANSDESFSKSLTDKDGPLSKFGSMDFLNHPQKSEPDVNDMGGADISPGPDPYSNPDTQGMQGMPGEGMPAMGGEYNGGGDRGREMDAPDLMNNLSGGLNGLPDQVEQGMSQAMQEPFRGGGGGGGFEPMGGEMRGYEPQEEMPGNTRSQKEESYLSAAMGAMGVNDAGAYVRQTIPRWEDNSFSSNYNTHMFKKHTILRPTKDKYQSPFHDQQSYEKDW